MEGRVKKGGGNAWFISSALTVPTTMHVITLANVTIRKSRLKSELQDIKEETALISYVLYPRPVSVSGWCGPGVVTVN